MAKNERELTISDVAGGRVGWQPTMIPRARAAAVENDTLIAAMVAFWIVAIFGCTSQSGARAVGLLFTPAAFALGFWLWRISIGGFLSFIWQLFFFSSLIRRLIDYQLGWNAMNPVVIAPYLTALWCCVTLLRPSRRFVGSFGLIAAGLLWGVSIGILRNGTLPAFYAGLEWGVGPLIAAYMLTVRNDFRQVQRALGATALIGAIVLALYGIVQEFAPAGWDLYWISSADMASTIGLEARKLRVFSTMNSPWPFGMTLMALLVFLTGIHGWRFLRLPAIAVGLITLGASQTRAAWGGLVVGWVALIAVAGSTRKRFLAVTLLMTLTGSLVVVAISSKENGLSARLSTLASLNTDDSFAIRLKFYQSFLGDALGQPLGTGLGRTGVATRLSDDGAMLHFDSGLMNVPYVLGWMGATSYAAGLASLIFVVVHRRRLLSPHALAAGAACVGLLSQMLFLNSLVAATGVMFWTLLALCLREVQADQPAVAISRLKSLAGK